MDTKKIKKTMSGNIKKAKQKGNKIEVVAMKELKKIQKQMETTSKKVGAYVKKNPEKATLISAGLGAAIGTVTALLISKKAKNKKKK